jgi:SAM-dependent methyltransferase
MTATHTWEQAVQWLRDQPQQQDLVRHCYYDDPVQDAARRFYLSEEWQATRDLLARFLPGPQFRQGCAVLDLGAGRGIASYAFARDGWQVTALEPDASSLVGRGAIAVLRERTALPIQSLAGVAERLPLADGSFDLVYGRAVLHHARQLTSLCREVARVLRPGGVALWVREHVLSRPSDLGFFLQGHPLHRLYGGENAYTLAEYRVAITAAGLRLRQVLGPLENPVNHWPTSCADVDQHVRGQWQRWLGGRMARVLFKSPSLRRFATWFVSRRQHIPGRHFAFVGVKP